MAAIHQVWYGESAEAELSVWDERLVMVKQAQSYGGTPVDDGMPQSGPAVAAKTAFLADLQSYTVDNLSGLTASLTNYSSTALNLWSGTGTIGGKDYAGVGAILYIRDPITGGGNGRFNASDNAAGNWCETSTGWEIILPAAKTAFGCYVMDMGDVREGELEFRLYSGTTLMRILAIPTEPVDKPRSDQAMWVGYADGNRPFNRIEAHVRQYNVNPSSRDFIGFDDLAVGDLTPVPTADLPAVFYGANTTGDAAKTVTGAAQTARNAWVAASAITGFSTCDFESFAVGTLTSATLPFAGTGGAFTASLTTAESEATHSISSGSYTLAEIDNDAASLRWNTTPSGSKWYEWTSELKIVFSSAKSGIGFYITDLGNQNATLRVTLRRANGSGVSYYLPKATAMPGADSLLRFWGVTGEGLFTSVVLQTVYYLNLTADSYRNPMSALSAHDIVGIDDILVA